MAGIASEDLAVEPLRLGKPACTMQIERVADQRIVHGELVVASTAKVAGESPF